MGSAINEIPSIVNTEHYIALSHSTTFFICHQLTKNINVKISWHLLSPNKFLAFYYNAKVIPLWLLTYICVMPHCCNLYNNFLSKNMAICALLLWWWILTNGSNVQSSISNSFLLSWLPRKMLFFENKEKLNSPYLSQQILFWIKISLKKHLYLNVLKNIGRHLISWNFISICVNVVFNKTDQTNKRIAGLNKFLKVKYYWYLRNVNISLYIHCYNPCSAEWFEIEYQEDTCSQCLVRKNSDTCWCMRVEERAWSWAARMQWLKQACLICCYKCFWIILKECCYNTVCCVYLFQTLICKIFMLCCDELC